MSVVKRSCNCSLAKTFRQDAQVLEMPRIRPALDVRDVTLTDKRSEMGSHNDAILMSSNDDHLVVLVTRQRITWWWGPRAFRLLIRHTFPPLFAGFLQDLARSGVFAYPFN
jgi:hypothetical protein